MPDHGWPTDLDALAAARGSIRCCSRTIACALAPHTLENVGPQPWRVISVELKV